MTVRPKIPSSIKNRTMYKPAHYLVKQVNILVFTRYGSSLKGPSGQTLVSSLLPRYLERFSNIGVSLGCLYYLHTKVCLQITTGGNLCQVRTSKFIWEAN